MSSAVIDISTGELIDAVDATFDDTDIPRPILWSLLSSDEAEAEWLLLNEWVEETRHTFAIPVQVIPPFWHRHPILVEHLSALRTHYLAAFDPNQNASAPFGWLRDLAEWESRVREIVALLGTRPGEPTPEPADAPPPICLPDRYADFLTYVAWDVTRRRQREALT